MKRRITDLFKMMFSKTKKLFGSKKKSSETKIETVEKSSMFQYRKKPPSRWITRHNQIQGQRSNKVNKRRKANKVASKQRQINRKVA